MNSGCRAILVAGCFSISVLLCGCTSEEEKREIRLQELRERVTASFLLGAIGYIAIGLMGPSVAEKGRKWVVGRFHLSTAAQIALAGGIYALAILVVILFCIFDKYLRSGIPAVILLLGATVYPFFGHVIPSLRTGDVQQRKAAVGQIKSFLMLIFIFYVILHFLSPEGFGEIQAK